MNSKPKPAERRVQQAVHNPPNAEAERKDIAPSETAREKFMRAISGNPRFQEAKPSGRGFTIVGAKPSR